MTASRTQPSLNVLIFAASLRADSLNRQLATLAAGVAQQAGATVDLAAMREFDVPSYDGDIEQSEGIPKGAHELRRRLIACDAFIVASPEYNGSMPGVFKNLIDWTSRFRPQPFDGKQGLLMSASRLRSVGAKLFRAPAYSWWFTLGQTVCPMPARSRHRHKV